MGCWSWLCSRFPCEDEQGGRRIHSTSLPMHMKVQLPPNLIYLCKLIPNGPQRSSSKERDGQCPTLALCYSTSPEWLRATTTGGGPPGSQGWELARPGQGRGPDGLADHFPSFPSLRAAAPSIHMVASQAPQTEELRLIDHLLPVESTSWWVAPPSFAHSFSKHVQTTRHCTRHQDNNKEEG